MRSRQVEGVERWGDLPRSVRVNTAPPVAGSQPVTGAGVLTKGCMSATGNKSSTVKGSTRKPRATKPVTSLSAPKGSAKKARATKAAIEMPAIKPAAVKPAAVKPAAIKPAAIKPAAAKPAVDMPGGRCFWAATDPLLGAYHDEEWGVPVHDDHHWFEKLILDGAQAGLSWLTILRKRDAYREAYLGFDPERVARFGPDDEARLMLNAGIVRNGAKIRSSVRNARAFLAVQAEHGSFDAYIWKFVEGRPLQGRARGPAEIPARTPLSDHVSADLRKRGFSFVGSTIVYAFMQAAGLINDHTADCFRQVPVARLR